MVLPSLPCLSFVFRLVQQIPLARQCAGTQVSRTTWPAAPMPMGTQVFVQPFLTSVVFTEFEIGLLSSFSSEKWASFLKFLLLCLLMTSCHCSFSRSSSMHHACSSSFSGISSKMFSSLFIHGTQSRSPPHRTQLCSVYFRATTPKRSTVISLLLTFPPCFPPSFGQKLLPPQRGSLPPLPKRFALVFQFQL